MQYDVVRRAALPLLHLIANIIHTFFFPYFFLSLTSAAEGGRRLHSGGGNGGGTKEKGKGDYGEEKLGAICGVYKGGKM